MGRVLVSGWFGERGCKTRCHDGGSRTDVFSDVGKNCFLEYDMILTSNL